MRESRAAAVRVWQMDHDTLAWECPCGVGARWVFDDDEDQAPGWTSIHDAAREHAQGCLSIAIDHCARWLQSAWVVAL